MTLLQQLLWGSLYLGLCLALETALLLLCFTLTRRRLEQLRLTWRIWRGVVVMGVAIALVVLAHTAQVWVWASALIFAQAMPDWNTAVYFSLVTYTTLGYGDVVLGDGLRIFAAFGAVTGLFAFGISTAFLVAVLRGIFVVDDRRLHQ
ncbi:potassium channel family protein [Phaeobacter sp.]|uniref:potassium channel family protein n=1 Tax=Phaeobacter sp. TaxID=1902409 RepID=UPI0025EA9F9A|nr:potassium channel family protein [Phaeobacter sp.]